ncbi:MAG: T9SS type A sorting domain-containing protein [Candidatus Eisenbacteria bacterium]
MFEKVVGAQVWQQVVPSVQVTRPNGGETLYLGMPDTLRWSVTNPSHVTGFDLAVSLTGVAGPYLPIASVGAATRQFAWNPAAAASSADCFLRVTATGTPGALAGDESDAAFNLVDLATPTQMNLFTATALEAGIEVRWQFGEGSDVLSARLLRGETQAGPWTEVAGTVHVADGTTVLLDDGAPAGRTSYYRIVARTTEGRELTFGPVAASALEPVLAYALGRATPNPASGPVKIEFSLPVRAQVEIGVLDVQGRLVEQLATATYAPGRHTLTWARAGQCAPGMYFVRYRSGGHELTKRITIVK